MVFLNMTETIGIILGNASTTTTGSLFLTLFLVMLLLIVVSIFFGIQLEYISIILLPYLLAVAGQYQNFVAPLGVVLIYLATIVTKVWIFK